MANISISRTLVTLILPALCLLGTAGPLSAQKDKGAAPEKPKHFLDTLGIGLKWRGVGPALTSGRIADFAVHPQNRAHYYVAVASGGVWKTQNAGTTYEPVFDAQGSFSIGCITMDPSNPNTLWVGTGENNNQRSVAYGDGIYRSNDGGKSWENMGLKNSEHIGRIIVHPNNSDVVWVAAIGPLWSEGGDRGVYKTTDGGKTWEQVLKIDEHTGVNDIVMDPRDPDVLYAAAFQRRRHVFTWVGGGPGSGMYKTKDGGKTWAKANNGLPQVDLGRIGLAISPANPEILYAVIEAAQGEGGFFKSTDRAASWEKQSSHTTSGNYYCELFPHPTNPDVLWSMDAFMSWTRDGGKTFQTFNEQWKHIDNHAMWFDPKDPNYILNGNDGGIYESFDAGKTWDFKPNLPITQFYRVAVDNAEPFYNIYGGTQDNFSLGGPSRTKNQHGIMNHDWFITLGGDGFESQIDPVNPNIVYAQLQHGVIVRYDKASGESIGIQPKPREGEAQYRWNWDSPLQLSAHQPTRLYFCANKVFRTDDRGDAWKVVSPDLTRQLDRNAMKVMGRVQSFEAVAKNQSTSEYGNIVAFSESPLDANLLFVGTDDGLVQIGENASESGGWTKIENFPGVPELTYVNFLLASQHDKNTVYAAFNNHKRGDFKPYLLKSTDKGRSWTSIAANLPERGSVYCIAEDHVNPNLLFCGTEFGCFFSVDGGKYWKKLGTGLPTICVKDMAIQKRENDLVLATFGRGFYVLDDYAPLRGLSDKTPEQAAQIFPIKDGLVYVEALPWGLRGKAFQGASFYTAPNPPVGATFSYFVKTEHKTRKDRRREAEKKLAKDGKDIAYPTYADVEKERLEEAPMLHFTIRDAAGNIVRKLSTKHAKGLNRITWDGRFPTKTPISMGTPPENLFGNPDLGPLAAPGEYTVSMSQTIDNQTTELVAPQKFRLNTLGGVTLPAADRPALAAFHNEANEVQRQYSAATATLGDLNNRLQHIRRAIEATPLPSKDLLEELRGMEAQARDLQKAFYGDGLAFSLDKPRMASIGDRIGDVTYEIWSSSSMPTATHFENLRLARQGLKTALPQLRQLVEQDLKGLEKKLEEKGAPYTPGRGIGNDE
jgi:photosystem II stability/assembly factor-like uncharacterized protein